MINRDGEYLSVLQDHYASSGVIPPFSRIAKLIGLKTTSAVSALVDRLKVAGYLESTQDRQLVPTSKFFERVLADSVKAGIPDSSNNTRLDIVSIDNYLIEKPSHTILLLVKGDSMIDAGILEGDVVIVVKGAPCKAGDVVVAIVDNDLTVKYLDCDKKGYFLRPGNPSYDLIRPKMQLEIFGLVAGSFRKY